MKKILLLILLAGAAQATEVYRYTDENGVTHYTDKAPSKDAAPAKLPALQTMPSLSGKVNTSTSSASAPKVFVPDFSLSISSPTPEQTFRNPGEAVEVSVSVMPGLAAGYGLIYSVDGSAQNPDPTLSTSLSLPGLERGSHSIGVALVDAQGNEVASSSVTVHMKPPVAKNN